MLYLEKYKGGGLCNRCGTSLTGKQQRWCSLKCQQLGLKREYKQRYPENVLKWSRNRRNRDLNRKVPNKAKVYLNDKPCFRCKAKEGLEIHHIKPVRAGGDHSFENLMALCKHCHREWEMRMVGYWFNEK